MIQNAFFNHEPCKLTLKDLNLVFYLSVYVVEHIKHKLNSIIVYIQIVIHRVYARINIIVI